VTVNPPLRLLLVESDATALAYLSAVLRKAGFETLGARLGKEGLIEAWRNRPDLIILDKELTDLDGLEIVKKLRADARTAQTKIILLASASQPEAILESVQAGANEYVVKRVGVDAELLERVRALFPAGEAVAAEAERAPGRLISFLSAKGGTGTSSLCANLAQTLAGLVSPKTVAVVDLVLPIGSISQIVGANSPKTVVEASQLEPGLMTRARVEPLLAHVPEWKFHLLSGAPDPEAAQELKVERLEAVFNILRQRHDYVLVDVGRALSRVSLPLIRASVRVVLVLASDAATVALTKTTLKYLETQNVRRNHIYPVLNRAVGVEGLSRAELEKELGLIIPGVVPHMGGGFSLANNQHQPIAAKFPNDTAALVLHDLAVGLLSQIEETVAA
jgi:pilus assembly protein CpaE